MEERKAFNFFRSYYEAANALTDPAERAEYLMAVCAYALDNVEPVLSGVPAALFALTRPTLDASKKKADAGRSGGKQTASKPQANGKQTASEEDKGERIKEEGEGVYPPKSPLGMSKQAYEQAFEAFWDLYPKKRSKGQAKTTWDKLRLSGETIAAIMAKLPKLIASPDWQKESGRFVPYPSTWLNAQGWLDEVSPSAAPSGDKNRAGVTIPANARKNAEWMRRALEEEE